MRILVFGLSLSSSWGNGHATTYRALLKGLAQSGHHVDFLEREQPWYAQHRDLARPDFCSLAFYERVDDLREWQRLVTQADAIIVGSFVPEALRVIDWIDANRNSLLCFYDIDTPVTLRKLAAGDFEYLSPDTIPLFDRYLSFTGGPTLRTLEQTYGARQPSALYCSVDPSLYRPTGAARRWDLGYLGTYSADRQPRLEQLLIEVARHCSARRFVVAGAQFPTTIAWPRNVDRIEHLTPDRHADFYSSLGWALNVTRDDMICAGYSPSVRLFEATACGAPVLSDRWPGLEEVLEPGHEVLIADSAIDVIAALEMPQEQRCGIGDRGLARTLAQHTGQKRATQLEELLGVRSRFPGIGAG